MKMKQTMKRWLAYILAVAMIVALVPTRTEAKTCAQHTVFSKKQINERISTIRDYYYNKPKQLTIKKQNVSLYGDNFTISYYIHDKDLMFGYGVDGKTEYRLYFYKTQLIRFSCLLMNQVNPARHIRSCIKSWRRLSMMSH